MRAVVDHHVDRPGVDAQQCVQLTGPNRSIALENLSIPIPSTQARCRVTGTRNQEKTSARQRRPIPWMLNPGPCALLRRPGGHGEGATPDPIPNSTVKPLRADGTASQDAGE